MSSFMEELKKQKNKWYIHKLSVRGKEMGKIKNNPIFKIEEEGVMADVSEGCGEFSFGNNFFFFKGYRFYILGSFGSRVKNKPMGSYISYCIKKQINPRKESSFVSFGNDVFLEYR